jgi:hypothetical protein
MVYLFYVILIILISIIPNLSNNNKTRLSILVDKNISKGLILLIILFVLLEDYTLGILSLILYFTILLNTINSVEDFQDYYK